MSTMDFLYLESSAEMSILYMQFCTFLICNNVHFYYAINIVEAFERVNGIKIPYVIDDRRAGGVPVVYSDPSKAERELGWRAEYGINEMVRDSWNWQKRKPNGFE